MGIRGIMLLSPAAIGLFLGIIQFLESVANCLVHDVGECAVFLAEPQAGRVLVPLDERSALMNGRACLLAGSAEADNEELLAVALLRKDENGVFDLVREPRCREPGDSLIVADQTAKQMDAALVDVGESSLFVLGCFRLFATLESVSLFGEWHDD